jgi:hypothetical protein
MKRVIKMHKPEAHPICILGACIIWKHRNACVVEGAASSVSMIWSELKNDHSCCCMAGAKKLQGLGLVLAD